MSYTDDYVRRYNAALDEARASISEDSSVENIDATFKSLFGPLIVEDISGAAHEPGLMDLLRSKATDRRSGSQE